MTPEQIAALSPEQQRQFLAWTTAQQGGLAPQQPGATEIASWDSRRRQTNLGYKQGLAENTFQRQGVNLGYGDERRRLGREFGRSRRAMPYQANARGLLRSGIYKQGLQDWGQDRTTALSGLLRQRQQALGGLDLGRQRLEENRTGSLGDIDAQEAARRQELAARLRSFA
jgi:hypothetical protein